MAQTSNKQSEILAFVRDFLSTNGYAPTVREICAAVGLRSTASVHYHLSELRRRGLIDMEDNKNRTLTLPPTCAEAGKVPVLGVVKAGLPVLTAEKIEGYIPWDGAAGCFALRVRDESMTGAGILDGDLAIVRPQDTADDGNIVLALLGDEAAVRRLSRRDGKVWLLPENDAFEPVDGREARILGKVRGLVRQY